MREMKELHAKQKKEREAEFLKRKQEKLAKKEAFKREYQAELARLELLPYRAYRKELRACGYSHSGANCKAAQKLTYDKIYAEVDNLIEQYPGDKLREFKSIKCGKGKGFDKMYCPLAQKAMTKQSQNRNKAKL